MPSDKFMYYQGRRLDVPKKGMKIVHRQLGYRGMVLMVTNLKYQNPQTIQVVFEGADNEIYSRPLSDFWEHWKPHTVQYIVACRVGGKVGFMRRSGSNIRWESDHTKATKLSYDEARQRQQALETIGAPGIYYIHTDDLSLDEIGDLIAFDAACDGPDSLV